MDLADKLIQLRKQKDWTQANAAKIINIQQSYLSKLENGRHLPSPDVIVKLCKAYNIQSSELLSLEQKNTKLTVLIYALLALSISSIVSGHLALFFPQTYYTYQTNSTPSNQPQELFLKIHVTDQYLGERYIKNISNNKYEYKLIAQRKISRIENRWLLGFGMVILLLTVGYLVSNIIRKKTSTI